MYDLISSNISVRVITMFHLKPSPRSVEEIAFRVLLTFDQGFVVNKIEIYLIIVSMNFSDDQWRSCYFCNNMNLLRELDKTYIPS